MNKQLKDLTDVELKALAYDEMTKIQIAQNNLKFLHEELNNRIAQKQSNQEQIPQQ